MNDHNKVIKKIFNLSRYDFSNHFTKLLSIAGLHAIIISLLFCGLCFVASDFDVTYWGWAPNIILDWTNKLYSLIIDGVPGWMLGVTSISLIAGLILLPLIIIQNCLDLAFDSAMRGYSMSGLVFSYIGAMIACNGFLLLFMELVSAIAIFAILYFMQTSFTVDVIIIRFFMIMTSVVMLYFMQLTYFLSMHILEYKAGIWQSCKDVYRMISGKSIFLCKVLLLQGLVAAGVMAFLYVGLGTVIKILMRFVLWFFTILSLPTEVLFIAMMYNFFYVWAYVMLYAWICLVTAHVYRQLICPSVENPSCESCNSCEK